MSGGLNDEIQRASSSSFIIPHSSFLYSEEEMMGDSTANHNVLPPIPEGFVLPFYYASLSKSSRQ